MTGDTNLSKAAISTAQDSCLTFVSQNDTLAEENPEFVALIGNISCPNDCSDNGECTGGMHRLL